MVTGEMKPGGSKIPEDHLSISLLVVIGKVALAVQGERKFLMFQYMPSTLTGLLGSETWCLDASPCKCMQLDNQERKLNPALPNRDRASLKYWTAACAVSQPDNTLSTYSY